MLSDIKYMPIKEFRRLGFIQEINRRLLHPCGLALEVVVDPETGEEVLGGIWDYRDDPEGLVFAEGVISRDKAQQVYDLFMAKFKSRRSALGYTIQPVKENEEDLNV